MELRWGTRLALVISLSAIVVASIFFVVKRGFDIIPSLTGCETSLNGHTVKLDLEQAENAALIVALSVKRDLPARAATIALATAYQESKLENLTGGDRDSLGLFQQRPSQGWGTRAQILDPVYATNKFYDALIKVDGYAQMAVTDAAQEVQRSAYPNAYADHELDARVLASTLSGEEAGGNFSCVTDGEASPEPDTLNKVGLTSRAAVVRRELPRAFGKVSLGGFEPEGVDSGHMPGSAHYEGRAIDAFVRPVSVANNRRGWAIAQYFVAMADRLSIRIVIFDDKIWTAGSWSDEGWRDYRVPSGSNGDQEILEHRDHVHIEVFD